MWRLCLGLLAGCGLFLPPLSGTDAGSLGAGVGGGTGGQMIDAVGGTGGDLGVGGMTSADDAGPLDAGILFQESFEGLTTASLVGSRFIFDSNARSSSAAVVDTTQGFDGGRSLRLDVGPGFDERKMWVLPTPVLPRLFVRFYALAPQLNTVAGAWIWVMASGRAQKPGVYNSMPFDSQIRFGGEADVYCAGYETPGYYVSQGPHSNCWYLSPSPIASGWSCIEYEFDAQQKVLNAWRDGALLRGLGPLGETIAGNFCEGMGTSNQLVFPSQIMNLSLGFVSFTTTGPRRSLWFDDVTVATSRIGCL